MFLRGLLKEYARFFAVVLRLCDVTALLIAGVGAYYLRFGHVAITAYYLILFSCSVFLTLVLFEFFHIYDSMRSQSIGQFIRKLLQALGLVFLMLIGLVFITKTSTIFSRTLLLWWMLCAGGLIVSFRLALLALLRFMRSRGMNERRVIIIGAGVVAKELMASIKQSVWTGFHVVEIFDDYAMNKPSTLEGVTVKQTPVDLAAYIELHSGKIDEIWLTLPLRAEERIKEILYQIRHQTIALRYVLNLFGLSMLAHTLTQLDKLSMVNLNASPMVGINRVIKAIEDRVLASCILIIVSPLMLVIALGIKLSSPGPVFYTQRRHGWYGSVITIYKFRTMFQHHEPAGCVTQARVNDVRITPFGRFLRQTSLDELPQFINVLQGRMSIVGPRPHPVEHNEYYKNAIKAYMQRHKVKPGMTGWAQINGWRGQTDTLLKMQKRIEYDLYYVENWSLSLDIKIIFLTLLRGFVHRNAY